MQIKRISSMRSLVNICASMALLIASAPAGMSSPAVGPLLKPDSADSGKDGKDAPSARSSNGSAKDTGAAKEEPDKAEAKKSGEAKSGHDKDSQEKTADKQPAKPAESADKPGDKDQPKSKDGKAQDKSGDAKTSAKPEPVIENVVAVASPEDLVQKPHEYLGKNVKFKATFFAFSNLALDYKPAFRSSKTHLSFLVLKPKSHVPLSELKLAMAVPGEKDPETQMLTTLKDGEPVEIIGKVFSTALDDPWVEVLKLKKLGGSDNKKSDKTASSAGGNASKTPSPGAKGSDKSGKPPGADGSKTPQSQRPSGSGQGGKTPASTGGSPTPGKR